MYWIIFYPIFVFNVKKKIIVGLGLIRYISSTDTKEYRSKSNVTFQFIFPLADLIPQRLPAKQSFHQLSYRNSSINVNIVKKLKPRFIF